MSRINKLADRVLARLAPRVTAEAACIYLYTECYTVGTCSGGGYYRECWKHYDNCAPKFAGGYCVYY